jgi:hypothetical protein
MMVTPRLNSVEKNRWGQSSFVESSQNANEFAYLLQKQETDDLKMIMISNRGTRSMAQRTLRIYRNVWITM